MKQYDYTNPDDFKALERQAYDGTIALDRLPAPEYKYFDMLRRIYHEFKFNGLAQDEAKRYKKIIHVEYIKNRQVYDGCRKAYGEYQDNIKRAGTLISDINKADSAKDIALKACEVIQLLTGEVSFADRQRRKINHG